MYTVGMVIYWNSNVNNLIFWDTDFWLSLALSSNHQKWKQKTVVVFYFTCNESKIYESFAFWNKLQEYFLDVPKDLLLWLFLPYTAIAELVAVS